MNNPLLLLKSKSAQQVGCLILVLLTGLPCAVSFAQPEPLDKEAVDAFVERTLEELLDESWMPGATAAVVQRDQIVSLRGVGEAEINTGRAIDPKKTLFRIGSISKIMATIAALRMVDRGELDLDADINNYLRSVKMPGGFDGPITLRLLLTHKAGLESLLLFHAVAFDEAEVDMNPEALQRELIRVRPTDSVRNYDNLAFGVLGLLLSEIQGKPLHEVIETEVFEPLGMSRALAGPPHDPDLDTASCHELTVDGQTRVCPQAFIMKISQASGDFSASAADMGKFMRAVINPELLLTPETAAQLLDFDKGRMHPRLPGLGLAMLEHDLGDRRCYGHAGSIHGFANIMCVYPEREIGVYVGINGNNEALDPLSITGMLRAEMPDLEKLGVLHAYEVVARFIAAFARAFAPENDYIATEPGVAELREEDLPGRYLRTDMTKHLWGRLLLPFFPAQVTRVREGELMLNDEGPYLVKDPLYYEYHDADAPLNLNKKLAFNVEQDKVVMSYGDFAGYFIQVRQPWYAAAQWTVLPFAGAALALLIALVYGFTGKVDARKKSLRVAGVSMLLMLSGTFLELEFADPIAQHQVGPVLVFAWRFLFPLAVIGFAWFLYRFPRHWQLCNSLPARSCHVLSGLACVVAVWLAVYWRLVFSAFA